jgi:hypothetical protein
MSILVINSKGNWKNHKDSSSEIFPKSQQANTGGSYPNSKELLSGPPQPLYQIPQRSHALISSPRWVQKGARVPNRCWHPSSSTKSTYMIITARQFTSVIQTSRQTKQINEAGKLVMHWILLMIQWIIASIY